MWVSVVSFIQNFEMMSRMGLLIIQLITALIDSDQNKGEIVLYLALGRNNKAPRIRT